MALRHGNSAAATEMLQKLDIATVLEAAYRRPLVKVMRDEVQAIMDGQLDEEYGNLKGYLQDPDVPARALLEMMYEAMAAIWPEGKGF